MAVYPEVAPQRNAFLPLSADEVLDYLMRGTNTITTHGGGWLPTFRKAPAPRLAAGTVAAQERHRSQRRQLRAWRRWQSRRPRLVRRPTSYARLWTFTPAQRVDE